MTNFAPLMDIPLDAKIWNAVMVCMQMCCCVMGRMCATKLTSLKSCQVQRMFSKQSNDQLVPPDQKAECLCFIYERK